MQQIKLGKLETSFRNNWNMKTSNITRRNRLRTKRLKINLLWTNSNSLKASDHCATLQMKGRWESNINVYSHLCIPRNETVTCISKRELYFSVSQFLHSYICKRFIHFLDRSDYSAAGKYVDRFWEYINRSQTHECGNWDWGREKKKKNEAAQFPEKENCTWLGYSLQCISKSML